jgi:hypothetical protein
MDSLGKRVLDRIIGMNLARKVLILKSLTTPMIWPLAQPSLIILPIGSARLMAGTAEEAEAYAFEALSLAAKSAYAQDVLGSAYEASKRPARIREFCADLQCGGLLRVDATRSGEFEFADRQLPDSPARQLKNRIGHSRDHSRKAVFADPGRNFTRVDDFRLHLRRVF